VQRRVLLFAAFVPCCANSSQRVSWLFATVGVPRTLPGIAEGKTPIRTGGTPVLLVSGKTGIGKLAEREGFEPSVAFKGYDALAKRCFRPLSHLSGSHSYYQTMVSHALPAKHPAPASSTCEMPPEGFAARKASQAGRLAMPRARLGSISASSGVNWPARNRWSPAKAIMAALSVLWAGAARCRVRAARAQRSAKT
jgi:hypothetical protein